MQQYELRNTQADVVAIRERAKECTRNGACDRRDEQSTRRHALGRFIAS